MEMDGGDQLLAKKDVMSLQRLCVYVCKRESETAYRIVQRIFH